MLIDRARIHVTAGKGGNGSMSFRREKFVPKGGPDGGDGGRGGDVRLRVKPNITSLLAFQYNQQFVAESGQGGSGRQKTGRSGSHLYIDVPPGTVVWDDETVSNSPISSNRGRRTSSPKAGKADSATSTSRRPPAGAADRRAR